MSLIWAVMPLPGRLVKVVGSALAANGFDFEIPATCSIMAWASGCSDLLSILLRICKICVSLCPALEEI